MQLLVCKLSKIICLAERTAYHVSSKTTAFEADETPPIELVRIEFSDSLLLWRDSLNWARLMHGTWLSSTHTDVRLLV